MPPLVSVIIPCYNGEDYIERAIHSVDKQDYNNIHIIVVDDNSNDDSVTVVRNISIETDITLIETHKNSGISATRNTGVEHAEGKYLGILDQDDVWYEDKVGIQVSYMEDNPSVGITYTDMDRMDSDGEIFGTRRVNIDLINMSTRELATYLFRYWENDPPLALTSALIRGEVFETVGKYDTDLFGANDRDLLARAVEHFDVTHLGQVLMAKRFHAQNVSNVSRQMLADRQQLTTKMIELYPFLEEYRSERYSHISLSLARRDITERNIIGIITNMMDAFQSAPVFSSRLILSALFR